MLCDLKHNNKKQISLTKYNPDVSAVMDLSEYTKLGGFFDGFLRRQT